MHQRFTAIVAAITISLLGTIGALAQDATPTGGDAFTSLGLPELQVTISNDALTVDQSEVPAGRYLVHFTNTSDNPDASAGFVRLLEGASLDDLSWADEVAAGTPVPGEMDPQPAGLEWLYDTFITGAGSALSPEAVVDLPAGDYGVWADDPVSPIPAAPLTVTGDPEEPITGPEPEAAITIVEEGAGGEGFHFTVQGSFVGGSQVVKVLNASDQPHFILGFSTRSPSPKNS